jgi:hypothetical protein
MGIMRHGGVITRMSSDIPFQHKRMDICPTNEHSLFASGIYGYKKMVSNVKHKMSFITFLQSCDIIFCKICAAMCGKCVIVYTIRAGEFRFLEIPLWCDTQRCLPVSAKLSRLHVCLGSVHHHIIVVFVSIEVLVRR